ncbi:MAG TPA: hypothetical protein O0X70_00220 [Methanocorpusculum sp.]|nr:hypothetical protein [Methanocorpusculum sp.]
MNSIALFESKAKKEIRKNGGLARGAVLYIEEDHTYKTPRERSDQGDEHGFAVRTYALRIFLANLLIKRTDVQFSSEKTGALIVCAKTLDDTACGLLENVFSGTVTEYMLEEKKHLCPFAALTSEEVFAYARHFGWKAPRERSDQGDEHSFAVRPSRERSDQGDEHDFAVRRGAPGPESSLAADFLKRFGAEHPATPYALKNIADTLKTMDLKHG